jgi:hypothetical protein
MVSGESQRERRSRVGYGDPQVVSRATGPSESYGITAFAMV